MFIVTLLLNILAQIFQLVDLSIISISIMPLAFLLVNLRVSNHKILFSTMIIQNAMKKSHWLFVKGTDANVPVGL